MEHVPVVANVSTGGRLLYQPECSCGWKGWVTTYKKTAKIRAIEHMQKEKYGNVATNS